MTFTDEQVLGELMLSRNHPAHEELYQEGIKVGKLYTDHGLPVDIALDNLDRSLEQKLVILDGACSWLIEHRRNSNTTEKALDRQRKNNREIVRRFLETGETGLY